MCGQILLGPPTEKRFQRFCKRNSYLNIDSSILRKYYFNTPYLSIDKYREALGLLSIFANYFCEVGTRLKIKDKGMREDIRKAKDYIQKHFREDICLSDVAEHLSLSENYFGNLFKKETNINFTYYIQQFRVKETQKLLISTVPLTFNNFAIRLIKLNTYNKL
jgi:hypothetical protein